ncbi:MAG: MerR family transcriptional regulator [Methylobacterium sp.]|uniref:MerR family transcriptional regulator n=1 Tax=Methylobacterium sp. TaxID=409 RepID=UPI0025F301C5|nr:MerR family transcriptional regulator [Methylobacterium sp.]MBX9931235.1 MerR family transcriptional regulator [Methylobacterium sp.]
MAGIAIGELSHRTQVKIPTIRYYEQIGLLGPAIRTEGKQRRYEETDIERLDFIRNARELGFEVQAIRELMELDAFPNRPGAPLDEIAQRQLDLVQSKIDRLLRLRAVLEGVVSKSGQGGLREVRVIQAFTLQGEGSLKSEPPSDVFP